MGKASYLTCDDFHPSISTAVAIQLDESYDERRALQSWLFETERIKVETIRHNLICLMCY
jgi:hypothetical protein